MLLKCRNLFHCKSFSSFQKLLLMNRHVLFWTSRVKFRFWIQNLNLISSFSTWKFPLNVKKIPSLIGFFRKSIQVLVYWNYSISPVLKKNHPLMTSSRPHFLGTRFKYFQWIDSNRYYILFFVRIDKKSNNDVSDLILNQ